MTTLSSSKSTTILMPAAGWGSRMGYPNSKEILMNPAVGMPYIQYAIESVKGLDCQIKIITRPEKVDLINWVFDYKKQNPGCDVDLFYISASEEWPDTLVQSQKIWTAYNIVLLPDTDWKPQNIVLSLRQHLDYFMVTYATFKTSKLNWGFVKTQNGVLEVIEKPEFAMSSFSAWGMFGFRKEAGLPVLGVHLESTMDHGIKRLRLDTKLLSLEEFNDRTRGENRP